MIVRSLALWALFVICASHAAAQTYEYDERGRLIRASYSDCSTIRYFYDAAGNRTERIVLAGDGSCAGNQAPAAANDAIMMAPGETGLFDLLAAHENGSADSDPNGDPIRIVSVEQGTVPATPAGALGVQLQDDRRQVRIMAPGTVGSYGFSYRIEDAFGLTDDAQVQLTVQTGGGTPTNSSPEPSDDYLFVVSGSVRAINVLANDDDPDGDTLYLDSVTGGSAGGTASIVNGQVEIIAGTAREETFTYTVRDRETGGLQGQAVIRATVNRHPDLVSETYTFSPGETRSLDVLNNDSDPDTPYGGQPIEIYAVTHVNGGATANHVNGLTISYTAPNVPGNYHFNYWVRDNAGGVSDVRSYVEVEAPQNTCPVARNDSVTFNSSQSGTINVLANDTDADGDTLRLVTVGSVSGGGSASRSGNQVSFTAPAGPANSSFNYTITDETCSRSATVTVTTSAPVNRPPAPPTVSKTGLTQGLEMWVGIPLSSMDPDGDAVTLQSVSSGSRGGTAQLLGGSRPDVIRVWSSASKGQWEDFTYTVSDGVNPPVSGTMRVRVDNYAPVVNGNSYSFLPGQTRTLTDILSNDGDPDGDPLRIDRVYAFSGGGSGSVVNNGQAVSYTARSTAGTSSFWLVVVDPSGAYAAQRVDITVAGLPPIDPCGGGIQCP
jgi:YD repeat-containing protein